jgi:citrate lyase beta subunit
MATILRSLLFTPANRVAAFEKALGAGADCVCLDLEDAVPPYAKSAARPDALDFLVGDGAKGPIRGVRINALSSAAGARDLAGLADAAPKGGLLMLPKVGSAAEIQLVASILDEVGSDTGLIALVETAEGLSAVEDIARSSDRLRALMFGGIDLSAELGAEMNSDTMRAARARIVLAARAGGRDVLDVPELDFRDAEKVHHAAQNAVANGFTGKAAIHPSNLATINAAFTPTTEEIARAQEIVAAFEVAPSGLVVIGGKLIEAPVIKGMRKRIAIARAAGVL